MTTEALAAARTAPRAAARGDLWRRATNVSPDAREPIVLLRVAGLAAETLAWFQCPDVLQRARLVESTLDRLEARRQARCDSVYQLVPRHTGETRRALLDLKRAVHNDRFPAEPLETPGLAKALAEHASLGEELATWQIEVRTYHDAISGGAEAVREDWLGVERGLSQAWRDQLLRRGVLHAQPELYRQLEKPGCLSTPVPISPKRRELRWQLSLLAYAYRAATKTSPFSTLTLTAVGRPTAGVGACTVPEPTELHSVLVLAPHLIGALAQRWLARSDAAARAPLRAPDLFALRDDQVVYLHASSPHGAPADEALRTLVNAPIAQLALHLLRRAPGPHSLSSFSEALAATLGCDERAASTLVQDLLGLGVLRPTLDFDACRPGALGRLAAAGAALGATSVTPDAVLAATVAERLESLAGLPAEEQAIGLTTACSTLNELLGDDSASEPARSVFDRCGISGTVATPLVTIGFLEPALRELLGALPLFNVEHGAERLVQDFFRARCAGGARIPILTAFAELREHLARRFGVDEQDPLVRAAEECERASTATASRQSLLAELRALVSGAAGGALSLPATFLRSWAERARPYAPRRTRLSAAFLGQLIDTGEPSRPWFVLNGVVSGYGALAAAWARSDPAESAGTYLRRRLQEELQALDPGGDVVEIGTAMDFGGQVREQITLRTLRYPGEPSRREHERGMDCSELDLALDPRLDRVTLVRGGNRRRVLPLNLGTLSPTHFPPFYRFLMSLGPAFTPTFSLIDLLEEDLAEAARLAPRHYGRITAAPIVLGRETWCIPADALPRFGDRPFSFASFLELRRWARSLDLPRRVFVTGALTADLLHEGVDRQSLRRARKPFYVDFDDFASCALMGRFTRRVGPTIRISEMLPRLEQNPFADANHGRVVECVLEIQGDPIP